jgi:hypothetical protein
MQLDLARFLLHLKRGDSPGFAYLRETAKWLMVANVPVPRIVKPCGRLLYELRFFLPMAWDRLKALLIAQPLFASRCESLGLRLHLAVLPVISGHTILHIGDDVRFSGSFAVTSGKFYDHPTLKIGNRTFIGHEVTITCNRQVVIDEDVLIAESCKISDYDGHSIFMGERLSSTLPSAADIRP